MVVRRRAAPLILCGLVSICLTPSAGIGEPAERDRPYTLEDYFAREDFVAVTVAPGGGLIALERKRPATIGESYVAAGYSAGDYRSRRSDIWVIDSRTGGALWHTQGKPSSRTSFAPVWSPDGRALAFLESGPTAGVSLTIWDRATNSARSVPGIEVDVSVLVTSGVSVAEDRGNFLAWADASRVIIAARGSMPRQPLGTDMLLGLTQRWNSTWKGEVSKRTRDSRSPSICNDGVRLFEVSALNLRARQLFTGAIIGVSVARDAQKIAIVTSRRGRMELDNQPLSPAQSRRVANRNEYGYWEVEVIEPFAPAIVPRTVASGAGDMGPAVLPRWSRDGQRLAVVTGNVPQQREVPASVLIEFPSVDTLRIPTNSLVDAQALAALYVSMGVRRLDGKMWLAPTGPSMMGDEATGDAQIFSLGRVGVVVVDARGVAIVKFDGSRQLLSAERNSVHVETGGIGDRVCLQSSSGINCFHFQETESIEQYSFSIPPHTEMIGWADTTSLIVSGDTQEGSYVWRISRDGKQSSLAQSNEHIAQIAIPLSREVPYQVRGASRQAILYLPTVRHFGDHPPVVVTAYPLPQPLSSVAPGLMGNVNSVFAWHWHTLLGSGFAVYAVDFRRPRPVKASSSDYVDTVDLVMSEITPALDALRQRTEVDTSRLAFVGFSQGGYTALTLLGRSNAFRAIVAEVPLANLSTNLSATPELRLQDNCASTFELSGLVELEALEGFIRLGGPPYMRKREFVEYSPIFNLENADTPTLMFAAEFDPYGPAGAEQIYMMLLRKNVPVRLIVYWGENHVIASPGNLRDMVEEQIIWLKEYLVGDKQ